MKKVLLFIVMILLPMVASADPVEIEGIYYNLISKAKVAEVTKNPNKYTGDVVIPELVPYEGTDYRVTRIGDNAFEYCFELTSVTIPNSVTSIGKLAFRGNDKNFTSVTIPNSVTSIGTEAFAYCRGLTSVTLSNSLTSIEYRTFESCSSLTSFTIPNSVASIGEDVFFDCTSLTSVTIPNSVTSIGIGAFFNCSALISVTIPNSVTSIGIHAFYGCSSLTSVTIPNSVTRIGLETFCGCTNLTTVTIGSGIESIGSKAFASCQKLEDVYCYAKSVPTTSSDAFLDSYVSYANLYVYKKMVARYQATDPWKEFNIVGLPNPEHNLTYYLDDQIYKGPFSIPEEDPITPEPDPTPKEGYTFSGWTGEPTVMPEYDVDVKGYFSINKYKLTYMVDDAEYKTYEVEYGATIMPEPDPTNEGYTFSGWSTIPATMPANDVTVTGTFTVNKYKLIYMVDGEEYKSYDIEYGATITPEAWPTKEGYTFSGWEDLPETMPANDVTVTGTFIQNEQTTEITVDDVTYDITGEGTVTIVGSDQKGDVEIQVTIDINGQTFYVTVIGEYAFKDNLDITSLTIPEGITTIGDNAFNGCINLFVINIGKDVLKIGSMAFANIGSSAAARTRGESPLVVNCYAETVPDAENDAFLYTPVEDATLLVNDNLVDEYRMTAPWCYFGKIMGFEEAAGINTISIDSANARIYDMQGNRLDNPQKGVNIIRMKDGKTKKIIVK